MISIYITLLFLTTIFTFREFFYKNVENPSFPIAFLVNNLKKFNGFIQKLFKTILIFETGAVDILTLASIVFFFLIGFFYTNKPFIISLLIVAFEFIMIYFGNKGRIISISFVSIICFVIGYQLGQSRIMKKQQNLYFDNQKDLLH